MHKNFSKISEGLDLVVVWDLKVNILSAVASVVTVSLLLQWDNCAAYHHLQTDAKNGRAKWLMIVGTILQAHIRQCHSCVIYYVICMPCIIR